MVEGIERPPPNLVGLCLNPCGGSVFALCLSCSFELTTCTALSVITVKLKQYDCADAVYSTKKQNSKHITISLCRICLISRLPWASSLLHYTRELYGYIDGHRPCSIGHLPDFRICREDLTGYSSGLDPPVSVLGLSNKYKGDNTHMHCTPITYWILYAR